MPAISNVKILPTGFIRAQGVSDEHRDVAKTAASFESRFDAHKSTEATRREHATTLVNEYYDLVTDFYEYGWGQAFHFAPRYEGETFFESLARHECFLAHKAQFKENDNVIDLGCGVGGPLRAMVRFAGVNVTGVNNNAYQIRRAKRFDAQYGLESKTNYVRCDFNAMPFESNSIDGAYAIEAICHSGDKVRTFKEVLRVLKPGARLVSYDWIITDKHDPKDPLHKKLYDMILLGNALPTLDTPAQIVAALEEAGFEVEQAEDLIETQRKQNVKAIPWYEPLIGSLRNLTTIMGFRANPVGRLLTTNMIRLMEFARIAPKGSTQTTYILEEAAVGLAEAGKIGTFSPCFFICARKPLKA